MSTRLSKMTARRIVGLIIAAVLMAVLIPVGVYAQATGKIKGSVVDAETGEALAGATIVVKGTGLRATVGRDGRYSILDVPVGTYRIVATATGYARIAKAVDVSADEVTTVSFNFEGDIFKLEEEMVTGTRMEHTLGDVPVEAIVLTKEDIQKANVKNAAEALSLVTGIHRKDGRITMQGMPAGYTLVLIDGQRVYFGPGRHPVLEAYPADMIEKIEIVKGASSTVYGSDAIGGVVNIITKTASAKPTFSVSTGFGNYGTQNHTLTHGNTIGKMGYFLTFARHLSDGEDPAYDQYENNDLIADLRYKVNENHLFYVKPGYYHQKKIWSRPNDLMTIRRYMVNSGYKLEMGENLLDVMGAYRKFYREYPDKIAPEVDTYEADVKYSRRIAERYVALAGYHFHEDRIDWMGGWCDKDKHGSHGPYGQFEANMNRVTTIVGSRMEDHTWWGNKFCPEAKLLYNASDNIKLRASAAKAFRSPKPVEFFEGIRWRSGRYMRQDPDLGPTESWNYQAGAEIDFPGKAGKVRAYLFRNDIEGMLGKYEKTSETKAKEMKDGTVKNLPVYISTNYKEVRTQGLEVSVSKEFPYHLYGTVGYSFWNTENKDTGKELAYRPNIAKGTLYWPGAYGISINVRAQYVSSQYTDDENTQKLDPYVLVGVDIAKDILKYAQIFLTVDNLFDTEYEEYDDISGREFLGGLRVRF